MAGEVERYKWATDRLKTRLIEEEKAAKGAKSSDTTMEEASLTEEDAVKDRDDWRAKAIAAEENIERLKEIARTNMATHDRATQKIVDLCEENDNLKERIKKPDHSSLSRALEKEKEEYKARVTKLEEHNKTLKENGEWPKDQLNAKSGENESEVIKRMRTELAEKGEYIEKLKKALATAELVRRWA